MLLRSPITPLTFFSFSWQSKVLRHRGKPPNNRKKPPNPQQMGYRNELQRLMHVRNVKDARFGVMGDNLVDNA
jgi:hypothetical protein